MYAKPARYPISDLRDEPRFAYFFLFLSVALFASSEEIVDLTPSM